MAKSEEKLKLTEERVFRNLPSSVWAIAWSELYRLFGEQLNQDALDAMDAVWSGVVADMQDEMRRPVERTADSEDIMPSWKPDFPAVDRSCDGGTTD